MNNILFVTEKNTLQLIIVRFFREHHTADQTEHVEDLYFNGHHGIKVAAKCIKIFRNIQIEETIRAKICDKFFREGVRGWYMIRNPHQTNQFNKYFYTSPEDFQNHFEEVTNGQL